MREFHLSDFECEFLASMASRQPKPLNTTEETVALVLDSHFFVTSDSEFGDLSSEKEEMIDAGCDLVVEPEEPRYVLEMMRIFFLFIHRDSRY